MFTKTFPGFLVLMDRFGKITSHFIGRRIFFLNEKREQDKKKRSHLNKQERKKMWFIES
jgi:hypothetical protein